MRIFIVFLFISMIFGCSTSSIQKKEIQPLTSHPENFTLSPEEKSLIKKSDKLHAKFISKGLIIQEPIINKYIRDIAARLEPSTNSHINLNFYVLRDASINAFALPNGNIYLNAGLLTQLTNEEETAFVVAHEIAHVILRHGLIGLVDRKNKVVGAHVGDLFLMGTGLIYYATLSDLASFSRKMESESDKMAIRYVINAGYSPSKAMKAIDRLHENDYEIERSSIWSTHPEGDARTIKINQEIQTYSSTPETINSPYVPREHKPIRQKLIELVIKIRLRNKQYELAESFIKKEIKEGYESGTLYYYLAETNRLKIKNIRDYAKEHAWLYDVSFNDDLVSEMAKKKPVYLDAANDNYTKAEVLSPELIKVNRGRGLLAYQNNEGVVAKKYLNLYLQNNKIKDRRYIQSIIKNIKRGS